MKIKTSELTGIQLDWAVTAIEYGADQYGKTWGEHAHSKQITVPSRKDYIYSPSTNWAQGGPIIEREHISLNQRHDGWWIASIQYNYTDEAQHTQLALSPLIAAMRCFAMSKLGDEVEIPEELI